MKKRKSKSWSMAYCGMAAALCVALMLLGTIIPIAMFIAPVRRVPSHCPICRPRNPDAD